MSPVVEDDFEDEILDGADDEEDEEESSRHDADRYIPKWKRSNCPQSDSGHDPVIDKIAQKFGRVEYFCRYCHKRNWTPSELEFIADKILRDDSNAELCKVCVEEIGREALPYGHETGHTEWQLQKDGNGDPIVNEQDEVVYVGYPELICAKGHRWYKGEGTRRNINGKNPILFESHIYNRKRREIMVNEGVPDPAYTMDRWGKRPTTGLYNRTHPSGRKTNSAEQRRKGSGFFKG